MSARTCALLALLVVVMFGWGRVAGTTAASNRLGLPRITSPELFMEPETPPDVRFDQHGNRIDRAVGDYRVDRRGTLYEGHAPQAPLPRLKVPTT